MRKLYCAIVHGFLMQSAWFVKDGYWECCRCYTKFNKAEFEFWKMRLYQ